MIRGWINSCLRLKQSGAALRAAIFYLPIVLSAFTASRLTAIIKRKQNNIRNSTVISDEGFTTLYYSFDGIGKSLLDPPKPMLYSTLLQANTSINFCCLPD